MLGGVATEVLETTFGTDWSVGVSVAIGIYLVTYYAALFTWYRGLTKQQQGKVYTTGIGGFSLVFLFTWMLLFTMRVVGLPL
ncbi:MAG: hypothetical protein JRM80_07830 [Nitrososphaerota archaeon]|nr:hypothetical protein [Nitrososphaerota archaeon]